MLKKAHSLEKIDKKPFYLRTYSKKNKLLDEKVFKRLIKPFSTPHKYPETNDDFPKEDKAWKEFISQLEFKIQHAKYMRSMFGGYPGFSLM